MLERLMNHWCRHLKAAERGVARGLVHERKSLPERELGVGCPRFVRTRVRTTDEGQAAYRCYKGLQNKELR
jgi:hypothetical protein